MNEKQENTNDTLNGNNEEKKYIIVYSSYGYLKILEKELSNKLLTIYNFIQYKAVIDNYFKVKYFHNKRSLILFDKMNINSKINILIENIYQNEDPNNLPKKYTKNSQHRLYSCKTDLRQLNTGLSFFENDIKDNEILLFFREPSLIFSTTMKDKSIEVSQQGKTAFKINNDDPHYVLGNMGYNCGRHYYEIKLLTDPMIRSIVVGFAIKKEEKNLFSCEMNKFYGYILSDMKKTEIDFSKEEQENMLDYGEMCSINDNIGIMYDCRDDGVNIIFNRNKKNLGIAYKNLPKDLLYFPAVEMGFAGSKIQITNDLDFPEDS